MSDDKTKEQETPETPESTEEKNLDGVSEEETTEKSTEETGVEDDPKEEKERNREGYAQRHAKKELDEKPPQTTEPKADPLTVDDMVRQNQRLAVKSVTVITENDAEDARQLKQDINDNWEGVKKYYKNTSDAKIPTAEEIESDLLAAYAAYRNRNPVSDDTKDAARQISTTGPNGRGQGAPSNPKQTKKILGESRPMDQWYD